MTGKGTFSEISISALEKKEGFSQPTEEKEKNPRG